MLTPKQLSELPDNIVKLYEELEDDIIRDMARRIVKTDFITETTQWQLSRLQEMGITHDEVFNRLSKATGKSDEELIAMFNEAAEEAYNADKNAYNKAGYNPIPLTENSQLQKIINAGLVKTQALFKNLTNTTANTATQQFENALDTAYMQITSGAFDYNTAIRNCIKSLAEKGIATITYPTGHTDYLDVAVRRAALTGVGQTTGEMQIALAEEMGCDLVEVTAHNGARPSHMEWQGKVYSISGKHPKYPDFVKSTGYGTGAGLKGWNCRHDFFPFFEDSEPAYTQEELNEYENRKVTYNGVEMTEYDASQKQRAFERRIRATKRDLSGLDAAIKETDNQSLKESLQAEFDRKSVLLKKQEARIRDFTHQTGLYRDRAREQSYGFNKSVSQKAVSVNQRNQSFIAELNEVGIETIGFDYYAGDTNVLNELKTAYVQLANEYPEEVKDMILRYGFSSDKDVYGWYDKTKNEIVFNKNVFDFKKSLIEDYNELVKTNHSPKGTDYRACFYHEFGHRYAHFHSIDTKAIIEQMTEEYFKGYYTKKKADEMLIQNLSSYATTETRPKYQEVIAECFGEWYNSKEPRDFCEKYLRKVGVIE